MNANELAKGLEVFGKWVGGEHKLLNETATMLRQQQAEIEALKAENKSLIAELQEWEDDYDNESVSPYQSITNTKIEPTIVSYTHPAELTDEFRIKELESEIERLQDQLNEFFVARDLAILRKAQEK
jgi:uncharacterized small protein (DUF1192 family)